MQINQNIAAMNAQRNLMHTQGQLDSSLEKLSSGFRINRAADDAAGLVNSENLRAQIGGLGEAQSNAQDAISLIQTAEGAQSEVHASLQRIRDLVVDTGNVATNDAASVRANQDEINQLIQELDRVAEQTQFGTQTILDGDFEGQVFQVGANAGQTVDITIASVFAEDLGSDVGDALSAAADGVQGGTGEGADGVAALEDAFLEFINAEDEFTGIDVDDSDVFLSDAVSDALQVLDDAIASVSENRGELGALQNRMEATTRNLGVAQENLQAAESRIRDTDMASEMVEFTRHQILQQAGTSMLAQANMVPQSVLGLLQ